MSTFRAEGGRVIMRGAQRHPQTRELQMTGRGEESLSLAEARELNRTLTREPGADDGLADAIKRARLQRLMWWRVS